MHSRSPAGRTKGKALSNDRFEATIMLRSSGLAAIFVALLGQAALAQEPAPAADPVPLPVEVGNGPRFYASAEYLLWWIKSAPVPAPLLTASSDPVNNPRAI